MKSFNTSLLCGGLLSVLASSCATQPANTVKEERPNFIFIYMDDMGYSDVSCYGASEWQTPHIDSLASQGIQFTDCYSASPISSPSRAGFLTGRYPVRMGVQGVFFPESYTGLSPKEVTMAEVLKTKGYTTSCIGKWHLGHRERFLPLQQGFDEYYGIPYSNDMLGQVIMRGNEVEEYHVDIDNLTKNYTEEALQFIRKNADKPFFLYLAHNMMHLPIYVSKGFAGKSGAGIYGDAMMEVDWSVGCIMAELRKLGLEDNTMVVFTSDNGPWLQEGPVGGSALPLREGKGTSFEGGVRVPCIAYWKGHIMPAVNREVMSLLDWYPTVASITGATLPDTKLDGYDISSVLNGTGKRASQDYAYFKNNRDVTDYRSGDWKISLPSGPIRGNFWRASTAAHDTLLFNLKEDISEQYNLSHKYPEKLKEMAEKIDNYKKNFGEIPPALVMWRNSSREYMIKQRESVIEEGKKNGLTPKVNEVHGFTDVY